MDWQAVRCVNKLLGPVMEQLDLAYEIESHWDGGEFSYEVHAIAKERVISEKCRLVAERFHLGEDELREMWECSFYIEQECFLRAIEAPLDDSKALVL